MATTADGAAAPPGVQLPVSLLLDYNDGGFVSVTLRWLIRVANVGPGAIVVGIETGFGAVLPPPNGGFVLGFPLVATGGYAVHFNHHVLLGTMGVSALTTYAFFDVGGISSNSLDLGLNFRFGASFIAAPGGVARFPFGADINVGDGATAYRFFAGVCF